MSEPNPSRVWIRDDSGNWIEVDESFSGTVTSISIAGHEWAVDMPVEDVMGICLATEPAEDTAANLYFMVEQ